MEIVTSDITKLKNTCRALAYKVAVLENPEQYWIPDEQIKNILESEGLQVTTKEEIK